MSNQKGFTLIELVVVIVVLGILAAVAIPKFIDLQVEARVSAVEGLNGAVKGATALAHAQALIDGQTAVAPQSITMEGATVELTYGYPVEAAGGIENALSFDGFDYEPTTGVFSLLSAPTPANCSVTYNEATGAAAPATSAIDTTGC